MRGRGGHAPGLYLVIRMTEVVVVQYTAVASVAMYCTFDVLAEIVTGAALPDASMRTVLLPWFVQ